MLNAEQLPNITYHESRITFDIISNKLLHVHRNTQKMNNFIHQLLLAFSIQIVHIACFSRHSLVIGLSRMFVLVCMLTHLTVPLESGNVFTTRPYSRSCEGQINLLSVQYLLARSSSVV